MDKTVVLFGGSFNPPHLGHLQMASYVHQKLKPDETWLLFSQNPEKDPKDYVPLEKRIEMAQILAAHFDTPLVMSDLEDKIAKEKGRYETYYILEGLREHFPTYKFVFVMGADSFANFHLWNERNDILASTLVVVVDRPGYRECALCSPTALEFANNRFEITDAGIAPHETGWCILDNPLIDLSSSGLLKSLRDGSYDDKGPMSDVISYMHDQRLYNLNERKGVCACQM